MELRVLTFNLHHHNDSLDRNAFEAQLDVVARLAPHLTFLQEVEQFTGYNGNRDSVAAIKAGLEARWGTTLAVFHCSPSGSTTQAGQHVMAVAKGVPMTLVAAKAIAHEKAILLLQAQFNGRTINFVTLHLRHGQAFPTTAFHTPGEGMRVTQAVDLNYQITQNLPPTAPRVLVGDFNTQPGHPALDPWRTWYFDFWAEAPTKATPSYAPWGETYMAGEPPSDATDYNRRVDYLFYGKRSWGGMMSWLRPLRAEVVDIRQADGSLVSDHNPLLGVFDVT